MKTSELLPMATMAINAATGRIKALGAENKQLHEQIQELQKPEPCSVCAGMGTLTGNPCICGGAGTMAEEMVGLRKQILKLEQELNPEDGTHNWKCTAPGVWESSYKCADCSKHVSIRTGSDEEPPMRKCIEAECTYCDSPVALVIDPKEEESS